MLSIQLHKTQFFAYHGLYEQEKIDGNYFEIDLAIHYEPNTIVEKIEDTIDYAAVFLLVNERMKIATPLLETLVMDITALIFRQFSMAQEVCISIKKLHPPIENFKGQVGVTYTKKR